MKAAWYERPGPADEVLCLGEMERPQVGPGDVLVRVHASGVNPSDVKTRGGTRGALAYPRIIPHSDGAGVIEAVSEGVDPARVGERVWVFNAAWQRAWGTAATYVAVPSAQAVVLPDGVSFEAGACLGIPATTAHRCVFADGPVRGQTVLVTGGAGAVGHYAVQWARWGGATVLTTVSSEAKAHHAQSAGAHHLINYKTQDVVEAVHELTQGQGVDRIVEVELGGNLEVSRQILKAHGVIVAYGSMAVRTPALPFYPMMYKNITLRMILVYLLPEAARRQAITDLNEVMQRGRLTHAIHQTYPLDDIVAAHQAVESGQVIGNVVVTL